LRQLGKKRRGWEEKPEEEGRKSNAKGKEWLVKQMKKGVDTTEGR
jgi:hypothetical protein